MTATIFKRDVQRAIAFLSAFVLAMTLIPASALADVDGELNAQGGIALPASGTWGCPWEIDAEGTLTVYPGDLKGTKYTDSSLPNGYSYRSPWYKYKDVVTRVVFVEGDDGATVNAPSNMQRMFKGFSNLQTADLSGLEFPERSSRIMVEMTSMFEDCVSLADLKWSNHDPGAYATAEVMFKNCRSLVSLDLSGLRLDNSDRTVDAGKSLIKVSAMFSGCSSLMDLKIPDLYTYASKKNHGNGYFTYTLARPTNMFAGCDSLIRITVGEYFALDELEYDSGLVETTWKNISTRKTFPSSTVFKPNGAYKGGGEYTDKSDLAGRAYGGGGTFINLNPSVAPPVIIEGENLTWSAAGGTGARFRSDAPIQVFENVKVDGNVLGEADFELASGSTAVTLTPAFLDTLSFGEHAIDITSLNGTASTTFTVSKPLDSSLELTFSQPTFTYDGTQKRPVVTVKDGTRTLVEGTDYAVTYPAASVAAGTYSLTVTGKGEYSGTKTASYEVAPATIERIALSATKFTYDGKQKRPVVTVTGVDGRALVEGTDYAVTYPAASVAVGNYSMTVAGKGNYTGSKTATFEVAAASQPDKPGIVEPGPDNPGTDAPGSSGPGNGGSGATDPGMTDPGSGKPGADAPGSSGPGTGGPDETDPGAPDSGAANPEPAATQVMYRLYNPNSGEHFYTASRDEREHLRSVGWEYEGHAWTAPVTSSTPVYRLYSGTDHHYTTSEVERDHLVSVGWSDEGIGWYSDDAKGIGLHRLFNPNVNPGAPTNNSGSHHYTTSDEERDFLVSIGWQYEDYGWHGVI